VKIHLIRHAHAGRRSAWDGEDKLRPLSPKGTAQAKAIGAALADANIDLLWTSAFVRCRQTLLPLATSVGLEIVDHGALIEGAWGTDALDAVLGAHAAGHTLAACSHGDVIPALVAAAVGRGAQLDGPRAITKGARYECTVADGQIDRIVAVPTPGRDA